MGVAGEVVIVATSEALLQKRLNKPETAEFCAWSGMRERHDPSSRVMILLRREKKTSPRSLTSHAYDQAQATPGIRGFPRTRHTDRLHWLPVKSITLADGRFLELPSHLPPCR
jgi:hypothetical protein